MPTEVHAGKKTDNNNESGISKYLKAAEQGDASAQFNLGDAYENGKGMRNGGLVS